MVGDVGDVVGTVDQSLRVDEIAVAARERGELVIRVPRDLVGGTDRVVEIAQQPERELLCSSKREVFSWSVERRPEDGCAEFGESFGAVTQRLAFDGSTRCCCFGIPPQQHPSASQTRQLDGLIVLVGEREGWGWLAWAEHGSILLMRATDGLQVEDRGAIERFEVAHVDPVFMYVDNMDSVYAKRVRAVR